MLVAESKDSGSLARMDGLIPANMAQAMDLAQVLATSTMIPEAYRGKPGDVLSAMYMGLEVGLKPMQALKNIAVINGRPALFGDALLAVIKTKPDYEYVNEQFDETKMQATCVAKRRGEPEVVRTFSLEDAKKAGLDKKSGPWSQYPKRMLAMRARAFALRDTFPHHLAGIHVAEEVQDIPERDVTPPAPVQALPAPESRTEAVKQMLQKSTSQAEAQGDQKTEQIAALTKKLAECKTSADLAKWAEESADLPEEVKAAVRPEFNKRKKELAK